VDRSIKEYLARPDDKMIEKGQIFLSEFDVQHEWVGWSGCNPNKLYDALQYAPLQASVDASATYTGTYSKAINHSITIYKADKNKRFYILDHYTRNTYTVPWGFYFGSAKQASLIKKKKVQLVQMPWLSDKLEASKIYAVYGGTACHIADEYSWNYGSKLGIWEKDRIVPLIEQSFYNKYIIGKQLSFK
jgi:hypothetical protein